jgi:hypothetical protein
LSESTRYRGTIFEKHNVPGIQFNSISCKDQDALIGCMEEIEGPHVLGVHCTRIHRQTIWVHVQGQFRGENRKRERGVQETKAEIERKIDRKSLH